MCYKCLFSSYYTYGIRLDIPFVPTSPVARHENRNNFSPQEIFCFLRRYLICRILNFYWNIMLLENKMKYYSHTRAHITPDL